MFTDLPAKEEALDREPFIILLDADDTLWESALYFERAEQDFLGLMTALGIAEDLVRRTVHRRDVERLSITGYGARPYMDTLRTILHDMVKTPPPWALGAMDSIEGNLLGHPVVLLPGVYDALVNLKSLPLVRVVYTMGERSHQTDKFERSGIAALVDGLRVVDRKCAVSLGSILFENGMTPDRCIVVGNSPRSDINPALELGAHAVHLLRDRTWAAEREDFIDPGAVRTIESLEELPAVVEALTDI